jgi:hypothetical protein
LSPLVCLANTVDIAHFPYISACYGDPEELSLKEEITFRADTDCYRVAAPRGMSQLFSVTGRIPFQYCAAF